MGQPATTHDPTEWKITTVTVEPKETPEGRVAVVRLDDAVRVVTDYADLDGADNLTFYRNGYEIADAKVLGVPLEVPTLVQRAIDHGETGEWE